LRVDGGVCESLMHPLMRYPTVTMLTFSGYARPVVVWRQVKKLL
jgi:hypothetical protein